MSDRTETATARFSTRPLYLQVRDQLAARIAAGEWKPNVAIPSEGDLARQLGVSSGTMRKALELMEGEHLLRRRQGRGTFVNDQTSDELTKRYSSIRMGDGNHVAEEVAVLDISQAPASPAECSRLRLRPDDGVWRIRRVRRHKGEPFTVEDVALPAALFPDLGEQKEPPRRISVIARQYGLLLGGGNERISLGSASPSVAATLNLQAGVPILILDRLLHTLDGRAIEWRLAMGQFAGKHYLAQIH
jgi:GntR family transcriptional regulator